MPCAIRFFFRKDCNTGAASPFPWTMSPFSQPARQQTSWKVPFDHGDGAPFPASKLLSRFEGVYPWTGKSSLSEKSIKANSCVSGSARQPCNRHTHMHTIWHQKVLGAVQLQPKHEDNFIYPAFKLYQSVPSISLLLSESSVHIINKLNQIHERDTTHSR